jgi:hypothetical protein
MVTSRWTSVVFAEVLRTGYRRAFPDGVQRQHGITRGVRLVKEIGDEI